MYLIVFVCAVIFPIVYLSIAPVPSTMMMIMSVGFIVSTIGVLLVLFGPKAALLWDGADVDENFAIVKNELSSAQSANVLHAVKNRISEIKKSSGSKKSSPSQGPTNSRVAPPHSQKIAS